MSLYSGTLQEFMDKTCDEIVGEMLGKFPDHSFKEEPDEKEVDAGHSRRGERHHILRGAGEEHDRADG